MTFIVHFLLIAVLSVTSSSIVPEPATLARIVNGYPVSMNDAGYQASLRKQGSVGWVHACGAVIVRNRALLTAAHCVADVNPSQLRVVVGSESRDTGGTSYDISHVFMHEVYSSTTLVNDIAVLKTAKTITFGQTTYPIGFAPPWLQISDGNEALVLGYGRTSFGGPYAPVLLAAKVNIVNQDLCLRAYIRRATITPGMICANASFPPRSACQGDSGGPLVLYNQLIGIVSRLDSCANSEYPGVYTRVSEYFEWILEKITLVYQ